MAFTVDQGQTIVIHIHGSGKATRGRQHAGRAVLAVAATLAVLILSLAKGGWVVLVPLGFASLLGTVIILFLVRLTRRKP